MPHASPSSRFRALLLVGTIVHAGGVAEPSAALAQDREGEVRAVVEGLFDAMRSGNGSAAERLFHPEARLKSIMLRDGRPEIRDDSAEGFIRAIGAPRADVWDERIRNLVIHVSDELAVAWMDYSFHLGVELSHCGVNVFELVRGPEGWQILGITDTRRRDGCG